MTDKRELQCIKLKITNEMVGAFCLFPAGYGYDNFTDINAGEMINCDLEKVPGKYKRSYSQLGLFWKACDVVASNIESKDWDTKEKVCEQVKLTLKFLDKSRILWFKYKDKNTGEQKEILHLHTKSISFSELKHLEACGFFTEAFNLLAEKMNMETDNFIEFVKSQMVGG